ncbi:MAG: DNA mismatch repair endonuclease MutL, partial [Verrucomicrobiota bacterium]
MVVRIRPLPDDVVNRIAAGEVVERPASVLKELLENAVDSGAGRVEAEASGPFPYTVRVTDDGCGMTREEAELAVRRHTTSKIATADDLERIGSFGFRGEALPSIASVARLTVVTRPRLQAVATELVAEGGEVRSVREAGAPPGTTVTVSGLFGNVPARRKFLKSERTELSHLWDVFHGVAIPGEGVSFRFRDSRGTVLYEERESAADRARRHAGDDAQYLVPVDLSSAFFRVFGWVGLPHLSRSAASGLWFFVNGRRFRDRGLYAAVREAYRGILAADRLPVAYLFITCAPSEVDVNVHPAKSEVRFRVARDLNELVRHAIGQALGEYPARSGQEPPLAGRGSLSWDRPVVPAGGGLEPAPGCLTASAGPAEPDRSGAAEAEIPAMLPFESRGDREGRFFSSLRPVGQVLGTFLVCEGGDAMKRYATGSRSAARIP